MVRFKVREEIGKDGKSVFYVQELPHVPGRVVEATATSQEGADWIIKEVERSRSLVNYS